MSNKKTFQRIMKKIMMFAIIAIMAVNVVAQEQKNEVEKGASR